MRKDKLTVTKGVVEMNIVLLSGGSGKRLWPLSNDIRSKQFIKLFKDENEAYESMVQRVFKQIKHADQDATITIATSKSQISSIHHQLGEQMNISLEPVRKDTFPAIVLATAYLRDVLGLSEDEVVIICPVDPYVDDTYFEALQELHLLANSGVANLVLMGIEPTYPSEKYGYILPTDGSKISFVQSFKEKPSTEIAQKYISQGALWNSGVFAYKIGYVLKKARELMDFTDYQDLFGRYEDLEKISFDYAVVEKEEDIAVMRYRGEWKDLGTWNTLTEVMDEQTVGKVYKNADCGNTHVINELDIPVLCMGVKDVVIAASPEGILISDKEQSSYIKPYVEKMTDRVMFAEKSWGSFKIIDIKDESLTIKVTLMAEHRMNYHCHQHRDEVWTVLSGTGHVILDEEILAIRAGDVVKIPANCKHTVVAHTELEMIEVQIGKDITIEDKIKYEFPNEM